MKSLYLVVVTATASSLISTLLCSQSAKDLRAESITLAAQDGREVRISATKDGLEIRSPDSMGSVQLIFAGEGNLSFRMIAQDSLFDVGVGGVPVITLKNKGDKGGMASMWAGASGGAASFLSNENAHSVSIDTQDMRAATVTLRRLGKEKPQLQLELTEKQPRVIQTTSD